MRPWMTTAILALAPLAAGAAEPPSEPAPMTLTQAIAQALATSPRMAAARAGLSSAQAQRLSARAEGLPTAGLSVSGRGQRPVTTITQFSRVTPSAQPPGSDPMPPGGIGLPPGSDQMPPAGPMGIPLPDGSVLVPKDRPLNPSYAFEPGLSISQPIATGGRVSAQRRAAKHGEQAAIIRAESEAQRLVLDVTEAYLGVLEARRQAQLAGALRELNEERLRVTQVRQSAGTAIPLETSQVEADLAQSVQTEIDAQARVSQSGATLNSLIGRPAAAPLALVDLPETPVTQASYSLPAPRTPPPTPERLRELGLERPDLRALREDVQRADAQVDVARAARRPQITFNSNYLLRVPATIMGSFAWTLGGVLSQSLFDGGRTRAGIDAARAERARSAAVLANAERQADAEVESARVGVDAAERRLAAEEKRVAAAVTAVENARLRRRAGTAAPIEVTETETTLARAQTDAITARFEAARARVRLAFAVGQAYPDAVPALAGISAARR